MTIDDPLDALWKNNAAVVRKFLELRPSYEKLAEEVAFILKRLISHAGIETSNISYRAKTLNSFCEKVKRKEYKSPIKDITDFAGARVTFLYIEDRPLIEDLIEKEFKVVESVDKVSKKNYEVFGYGALHYLVKLGNKYSGARYDELKGLICEIQVRTVLQDAWAIVDHHLSYKQESDVPIKLRRKLNALSGLFETADDQFQRLRDERKKYSTITKEGMLKSGKDFLNQEINLDNLIEYLSWKIPDREQDSREDVAELLPELSAIAIKNLKQLDDLVTSSSEAVKAYEKKYRPKDTETGELTLFTAVGLIRVSISFSEKAKGYGPDASEINEFRHLIRAKPVR